MSSQAMIITNSLFSTLQPSFDHQYSGLESTVPLRLRELNVELLYHNLLSYEILHINFSDLKRVAGAVLF